MDITNPKGLPRWLTPQLSVNFLILLLLLFMVLCNLSLLYNYQRLASESKRDAIDLRMRSFLSDLNVFPRTSVGDVSFLSRTSIMRNLLSNRTVPENGSADLAEFMRQNSAYYEIILTDPAGTEIYSLKDHSGTYTQNLLGRTPHSGDPFWPEISGLKEGEVVVSDILPEKDDGRVIPSLIHATSIYDGGQLKGRIILKTDANYFLDDIRNAAREGEVAFLVRGDGEYIANPQRSKEFGLDRGSSLFIDYPQITQSELANSTLSYIETDQKLFSIRRLTISGGYFTNSPSENRNSWLLVFVTDKTSLGQPEVKELLAYEAPIVIAMLVVLIASTYWGLRKDAPTPGVKRK